MWLPRQTIVLEATPEIMNINDVLYFGLGGSNVGSSLPVRRRSPNVANSASKRPRRAKCHAESLIMESHRSADLQPHGVHIDDL